MGVEIKKHLMGQIPVGIRCQLEIFLSAECSTEKHDIGVEIKKAADGRISGRH